MTFPEQLRHTAEYLRQITNDFSPQTALVLGSGLSDIVKDFEVAHTIPFAQIPNFGETTVPGHRGQLVFGRWAGKRIVAMAGRLHYYEGFSMKEVTFPIRVMKMLGAETLLMANAVGSLNPEIEVGHLCVINDHINLQSEHPLRGENFEEFGPRFLDMLRAYDPALIEAAMRIGKQKGFSIHQGVYVGVQGPTLETPAEYRYLHRIGGDIVGMSTVPETIVARHMGMRVFGIAVSTDQGYPTEAVKELSHQEVVRIARAAIPKVAVILREVIKSLE